MLSCQIEMCGTLLRIVKLLRKTLNLEIPLFKTKSMIVCYFSYLCGDVCGKLIKSFHGCSILRRRCLTSLILSFTTQWIGLLTVRGNSKNFTASGTFLSFLEIIAEKMNTWWVSLSFLCMSTIVSTFMPTGFMVHLCVDVDWKAKCSWETWELYFHCLPSQY